MTIDKTASREWRSRIREVLNRDWDPIGDCPPDEYDSYMGKLAVMIRENVSDAELMAYLEWAEVENMGLGQFDRERGTKVVAALRKLGPPPSL